MDLLEGLYTRRSIRKYTDKKVGDKELEKIIEAGMHAPSAVNKQPWHFIIFRDKATMEVIKEVHPSSGMLLNASAGILICFDTELEHDKGYGPVDCSAATQNMLLAAHGHGLGACWIGIYPREQRVKTLHKLFNLPEHVVPFAVVSVGNHEVRKQQPSRFNRDRIRYETW